MATKETMNAWQAARDRAGALGIRVVCTMYTPPLDDDQVDAMKALLDANEAIKQEIEQGI